MQPAYFSRPDPSEHAPGFGNYIALAPDGDLPAFLMTQLNELRQLLAAMDELTAMTIHAPYAWNIKQVIGHITDTERVFAYRLLRLARQDATPLPQFHENAWMEKSAFSRFRIGELLDEFALVRLSTISLARHTPEDAWLFQGTVSDHPMTSRALLYAIAGHAKHHMDILHKRLNR